ncbi:hypothetical protein [Janibacter terrae]|uniref:hypothetical protein n=1 Tax=Janibacter terrae TaxID=103817 RepID=UPI0031F993A2
MTCEHPSTDKPVSDWTREDYAVAAFKAEVQASRELTAELQDARWSAAYWEYMALRKKRVWWLGWDWRIHLGGDEYDRRTIVVGPVCIALWHDSEARERIADCERVMDDIDGEVAHG